MDAISWYSMPKYNIGWRKLPVSARAIEEAANLCRKKSDFSYPLP